MVPGRHVARSPHSGHGREKGSRACTMNSTASVPTRSLVPRRPHHDGTQQRRRTTPGAISPWIAHWRFQRALHAAGLAGLSVPPALRRPRPACRLRDGVAGGGRPLPADDRGAVHHARQLPADAAGVRHRPRNDAGTCPASSPDARSGASCSPNPARDPTSPASRPAPLRSPAAGSSTARRSGRPSPTAPTSASCSPAPIPTAAKHDGLSMFIVDLHAPGVEVRPIRQLDGAHALRRGLPHRRVRARRRRAAPVPGPVGASPRRCCTISASPAPPASGAGCATTARTVSSPRSGAASSTDPAVRDELARAVHRRGLPEPARHQIGDGRRRSGDRPRSDRLARQAHQRARRSAVRRPGVADRRRRTRWPGPVRRSAGPCGRSRPRRAVGRRRAVHLVAVHRRRHERDPALDHRRARARPAARACSGEPEPSGGARQSDGPSGLERTRGGAFPLRPAGP